MAVLRMGNLQNGEIDYRDLVYSSDEEDIAKYSLCPGDLLFNRTNSAELVGKTAIYRGSVPAIYAGYLIRIHPLVNPEYFNAVMNSQYAKQYCYYVKADSVSQSNINANKLGAFLIPIPPSNEQKSISKEVSVFLPIIFALQEHETKVKELCAEAKSKILDLAIRGKLVPQDSADEPASVLLERIRADKEEQIKAGKIKRDKKESFIFRGEDNSYYEKIGDEVRCIDDQLPYVIPENWVWARLSSISIINPKQTLDENLLVSFVPMPLIEDGFRSNNTSEVRKWKEVRTGYTHFADGDIGVAKITPCFENRKSLVFHGLTNGYGAGTTELFIIRCNNQLIVPEYLLWLMKTKAFIDGGIQTFSSAVGQQRVSKEYIENSLIPLPSVRAQKVICSKIRSLLSQIEQIEQSLN